LRDNLALLIGSAFLLALLVGSFLNVVIHRLPVMLDRQWKHQADEMLGREPAPATEPYNLIVPRSRCPHCGVEIKAHQNIPVLSYLMLGGKCASCGTPISPRYPIVEFATAVLSAAVVWRFGWHWQSIAALFLTWALVALTVIDLDHQILPDVLTLPLLWLGLLASLAWTAGLKPPMPVDPRSAVLGAVAGYLSLWLVYWAFKLLTGKEGMGYGDFKLFAALGAWMGWQMLPLVILLSAFTGAAVGIALIVVRGRDRNIPIPFGPYLAAAGWIALMWGPQIVGRYLSLTGLDR
jgi:leader peptidase (prepilin peptidase)/N-methyltransferase